MKLKIELHVHIPDFIYWLPVRWWISWTYRRQWNKYRGLKFEVQLARDFDSFFFYGDLAVVDELNKPTPMLVEGNWTHA